MILFYKNKRWWKNNEEYCIGRLSSKTRRIKIINMLTDHEDIIEVNIKLILYKYRFLKRKQ